MTPRLFPLIAVACGLMASGSAQAQDGKALLNKLLANPGSYGQICDASPVPVPVPIPGFQVRAFGEAGFSEKSVALMKKNRAVLVPALRKRFASVDLTRTPVQPPPDKSIPKDEQDVDPIGVDPLALSNLQLDMVVELKAIETLPELLVLEEKLLAALEKAAKDPKAPVPEIDGLSGAGIFPESKLNEAEDESATEGDPTPEETAKAEREHKLFLAEAGHRDVLAVMVHLLRYAGVDAVLKSDLEKEYGKGLKKNAEGNESLEKITKKEDIGPDDEGIVWDKVHQVARNKWQAVDLPYSPELRLQIRGWVEDYLKEHPAKEAEGGKAKEDAGKSKEKSKS